MAIWRKVNLSEFRAKIAAVPRILPVQPRLTRRQFIAGAAFAAGALPGRAMAGYWRIKERKVALHNLWTEEYLDLTYWRDGDYLAAPLADFGGGLP